VRRECCRNVGSIWLQPGRRLTYFANRRASGQFSAEAFYFAPTEGLSGGLRSQLRCEQERVRIRLKLLKESGSKNCRSSRVRGWDSSRILVRNCRKNRVFAKRGELSKVPGGGRRPWFLGDPPTVLLRAYPPDAQVRPRWSFPSGQKLKDACRVIIRFAVCELNGPPTKAFDSPNCGDVRIPIGVARFTLLKAFLTFTAKVRAYLLFVAPASIPRPPGPPPGPPRPGPPGPRQNVPPPIPPPWPAFAAL